VAIIKELHAERKALIKAVKWGAIWDKKKVDDIDHKIKTIRGFLLTMCRLKFHEDYPYKNQIETEEFLKNIMETIVK